MICPLVLNFSVVLSIFVATVVYDVVISCVNCIPFPATTTPYFADKALSVKASVLLSYVSESSVPVPSVFFVNVSGYDTVIPDANLPLLFIILTPSYAIPILLFASIVIGPLASTDNSYDVNFPLASVFTVVPSIFALIFCLVVSVSSYKICTPLPAVNSCFKDSWLLLAPVS